MVVVRKRRFDAKLTMEANLVSPGRAVPRSSGSVLINRGSSSFHTRAIAHAELRFWLFNELQCIGVRGTQRYLQRARKRVLRNGKEVLLSPP